MTDRECVIAQLMADMDIAKLTGESLVHITRETVMDALALLREQEPVEPITAREGRNKYWSYYVCPNCNEDLNYGQKYCCECGKAVKWNA